MKTVKAEESTTREVDAVSRICAHSEAIFAAKVTNFTRINGSSLFLLKEPHKPVKLKFCFV